MKKPVGIRLEIVKDVVELEINGDGQTLLALLVTTFHRNKELLELMRSAITVYEQEESSLDLLLKADDVEVIQQTEEFKDFWDKVEKKANGIPYIFMSDYYKYKGALDKLKKGVDDQIVDAAYSKISSMSNESGD